MTDMTKQAQIFDKILKKEENKLCADCRRKSPSWASLNLGVLICMKCSGIHRGLGVHISKVKSVNLDKWPQDALQNFQKINNKIANEYWESKLKDLNYEKLQNDDYKLHDLIKDKYERKKYCDTKKTDPMTLIIQGKSLNKADDDSFRDVEEDDVDSSDEDRSAKRKSKNDKGFKVNSQASGSTNANSKTINNTIKQEPLFQINNTNNENLISFDNQADYNNNKQSASNNANSNFNFLNNNNQNINLQNTINSNNSNFPNNSFPVNINNNRNGDLFDVKSGDNIVDEKLKKITDNIEELYKNSNNYLAGGGANAQGSSNKQNDLFNALNPQLNNSMNVKHNMGNVNFMNNPQNLQQQQMNLQNNFYNYGNNNQPHQNYINNNNHFYGNGMNMSYNKVHGIGTSGFQGGYGANYTGYPNVINYNQNQVFNGQQQMNYANNINRNMMANNNLNNGVLTANDIYNKKEDAFYNLNYNNQNVGNTNNFSNSNFLEFSDVKQKKNEDPFSNLISFK